MHFLSSAQVQLLQGRQIAFSDYETQLAYKNCDRFQVSKMGCGFKIKNKKLPIDPVFLCWVKFKEKVPIMNISRNSKSPRT